MDIPKKKRISTKKPVEKSYKRIYLNSFGLLAHIYLPEGPKAQVVRDLLINHDVSLIGLFLPEWVTTSIRDLEQATMARGHPKKSFTFWLSDGMNDQNKRLAVRIQKIRKSAINPYDILFGGFTNLPIRTEYSRNPREFYGMEKIDDDEFRIWKKSKITQIDGAEKRDIPPEIIQMIMEMVLESGSMTDLLPTILTCRLVNRSWLHFATTAACRRLIIFPDQLRAFFGSPKSNLYPYLAHLYLRSNDFQISTRNSLVYEHELVDLLIRSPNLVAINLNIHSYAEFVRIVGWRSNPESPQDRLAPDLIHTIDVSTIKIRRMISESDPNDIKTLSRNLWDVWEREMPHRFFCLSDPSRELLQAIGCALQALLQPFGGNESFSNRECLELRFEGGKQWTHIDAMKWLEREREWLATIWTKVISLVVITTDKKKINYMVRHNVGSPSLEWEILNSYKFQKMNRIQKIVSHTSEILSKH